MLNWTTEFFLNWFPSPSFIQINIITAMMNFNQNAYKLVFQSPILIWHDYSLLDVDFLVFLVFSLSRCVIYN